jgi:hypothetical protein
MTQSPSAVEIDFRIPGTWKQPGELIDGLPESYRFSMEGLADLSGPQFQVVSVRAMAQDEGTPMHNPFWRWKLVSVKDIAGQN